MSNLETVNVIGISGKTRYTIRKLRDIINQDDSSIPDIRILCPKIKLEVYKKEFPQVLVYSCPTLFANSPKRIPTPQPVSTLNGHDPHTLYDYLMTFIKIPDILHLILSFLPVVGHDGSKGQLLYGWRMIPKFNNNFIIVLDELGFFNREVFSIVSQARHFGINKIFILTSYEKQAPPNMRSKYTKEKYVK
jgi:hypothetical protein